MVVGASEPVVAILVDEAREAGGKAVSSVFGHDKAVTPAQAALINGTAAHALDFDDVNLAISGHPSAVLLPSLLALGEQLDSSGADLATAFLAGYETACRIGALVGPGHYDRGFHATATVGGYGAAMACARLLGLNAEQTARALGIAGTRASGLKAMFGTDCKPYHAGLAAENGVRATSLARRGMTARSDVLEAKQGFAATQSPDFKPEAALDDKRWFIRENLFKYHAACYGTHSTIECASALRTKHRLDPAAIEKVTVKVERVNDGTCNIAQPKSGLEAKFSLRFTAALTLAGRDTADLANYSETTLADPVIAGLMPRVAVELVDGVPPMKTAMEIATRSGDRFQTGYDSGEPVTDLVAQETRLRAKFNALCVPVLGRARAQELLEAVDSFTSVRVRDLIALCRPGRTT
jgi:2-methylcitrate dehydratase PrpD